MMRRLLPATFALSAISLLGQEVAAPTQQQQEPGLIPRQETPEGSILLPRGTRIPLALINSVSTKNSAPGDKIYLQSVFPVVVDGKIRVPPGTYVTGIVTEVKRPGRIKGRGEMHLRFEQMILPNGTIRDFNGSLAALEGASDETLNRETGKVKSEGGKGKDAGDVAQAAGAGAGIGTIAGAAGGNPMRGLAIGSASGAAAGLIGVLLTRGPEAILEKGSQLEMVLDRDLSFSPAEMTFTDPLQRAPVAPTRETQNQNTDNNRSPLALPPFFLL